uniref:Lipoprotein n=1 Tax=Panagrellus redivivus TaxID=6233 RepID=A0A7E4WDG0_PANRE
MPQTITVRQITPAITRIAACYTSGDSSTYVGATSEGIGSSIARGANAGICPGQFSDESRMQDRAAIALQYTGSQRYRQNAVCHKHGCFEGDEDGIRRVQR